MRKKEVFIALLILVSFLLIGCRSYFGEQVRGIDAGVTSTTAPSSEEIKLLQKIDADGSGKIDNGDFFLFNLHFGTLKGGGANEAGIFYNESFDYDDYGRGDGDVDYDDFFILSEHFGVLVPDIQSAEKPKKKETKFKIAIKKKLSGEYGYDAYESIFGTILLFPDQISGDYLELLFLAYSEETAESLAYPPTVYYEDDFGKRNFIDLLYRSRFYSENTYLARIPLSALQDGEIKLVVKASDPDKSYTVEEVRYLHLYSNKDFQCGKSVNNGPSDQKINLVFVSDGFKSLADLAYFGSSVPPQLAYNGENDKGFFSLEPLKSNKDKFNVFKVFNSKSFGCSDISSPQEGTLRCSQSIFKDIIKRSCNLEQADVIVVVSYNTAFRAYSSFSGFVFTYPHSVSTTVHELGHAFGQLEDEYWADYDETYLNFKLPSKENQDVKGCPRWCSGKIDTAADCYKAYEQWSKCVVPYRLGFQPNKEGLQSCWQTANDVSKEIAGVSLYDCALGVQCREQTQCYFTSHGVGSFRHIKNGIMSNQVYSDDYRYGIVSEEAIQKIIDNKLKRGAKKPVIGARKVFWYDTLDENGNIVSGGEIDFDKMDVELKAKVMAKTLELSEQITAEETQRYEERIENVLKFKAAKPPVFDPEIEVIDGVVDFEKKDIDVENINPSVLVDSYLEVVQNHD